MGEIGDDRAARPIPAAVAGARRLQAELDARRQRLPHRRPGALRHRARDRAAARLHHAADPQFLRELQPRAADLHRHALYVPGAARTAPTCARRCAPRTATGRSERPSTPRSPASPRATISSSTAATGAGGAAPHERDRRVNPFPIRARDRIPLHRLRRQRGAPGAGRARRAASPLRHDAAGKGRHHRGAGRRRLYAGNPAPLSATQACRSTACIAAASDS